MGICYYKGKLYKSENDLWNSEEGDKVKERIKKKRGYKCEITGLNYGNIEFHHIKPKSLYPELIFDEDNIIMVIYPIHNIIHTRFNLKKQNKETLEIIIKEYDFGMYDDIDLTTKRCHSGKKNFNIIKDGLHRGKQRYAIRDKNGNLIQKSIEKEKLKRILPVINEIFDYFIDDARVIKKYLRHYLYGTFYQMVSKF